MEPFEPIRDTATRLHDELVSVGIDPLKPLELVEAAIRRLDLELFWLARGDPALKGSRALLDEQSGSVYCEAVDDPASERCSSPMRSDTLVSTELRRCAV